MEHNKKFIFGKKMHEDHLFTYNLIFEDDNKEDRFYGISLKHELTVKEAEKLKEEVGNMSVSDSPFLRKPDCVTLVEMRVTLIYNMGFEETLSEYKKELGDQIPMEETVVIMMSALKGLEALHSKDLTHLNLTPANILLGPNKQVWLVGFGLTTILEGMNIPSNLNLCESLTPEMLDEAELTSSADIFCLGRIIFELCSENSLCRGKFEQISISQGNFNSLQSSVPSSLTQLINGMIEVHPDSRLTAEVAVESSDMEDLCSEQKLSEFYKNPASGLKEGSWSRIFLVKLPESKKQARLRSYFGSDLFLNSDGKVEERCVYCDSVFDQDDESVDHFRGKYFSGRTAHRQVMCFKLWTECLKALANDQFFCKDYPDSTERLLSDADSIDFSSRWFDCSHCNKKICIFCLESESSSYNNCRGENEFEGEICEPLAYYLQTREKELEGASFTPEERRKATEIIIKSTMLINKRMIEEKKSVEFAKMFTILAGQSTGKFSFDSIEALKVDQEKLSLLPGRWRMDI